MLFNAKDRQASLMKEKQAFHDYNNALLAPW